MKEGGVLNKVTLATIPRMLSWLIKVWFATCRVTVHDVQYREQCREHDNPVIATFWHYAILYNLYHMRKKTGVAMVSASKDGEYIARLVSFFGYAAVRGSRNRKGMQAMKEMMKFVSEGRHAAIVADGSQGPPQVVQAGSILLASRTESPILPLLWSASHYYAINSWDRMVIPKPFSRVDLFYGEPIVVPKDLKAEGLEEYRLQLERNLNGIYQKAWGLYGKTKH
jgi:lysophospholipid acyltransferase (LPLAT)-like uncharacterized protein